MGKIVVLDKSIANKIAAGEVIERPASIIKELIENSLDSEAKNIKISIEKGGQNLIEIIDDGTGMSKEDVELSIKRFATSKIKTWEDIEQINTFGFRGEALPSIAAVSKMEFFTKEDTDNDGTYLYTEGGEILKSESIGTPQGTKIRVKDLFFNTPARKKFLKSPSAETAHIVGIAQKLSLINKDVSFQVISNDREIFHFPRTMSIKERILKILGLPLKYDIIKIQHESPSIMISGYICRPDKLKSHRSYQYIFVNNRFIKNPMVSQAITEGFSPLLPAGKFPIALIFIDISGEDVDINVHPNKLEVRFLNPSSIFKAIRDSIKKELRTFGYSPDTQIFNKKFQTNNFSNSVSSIKNYKDISYLNSSLPPTNNNNKSTLKYNSLPLKYNEEPSNIPYNSPLDIKLPSGKFNAMAQLQKTYILGIKDDELWIVDQHTAHERINYEKLIHIKNMSNSQPILFPVMLELPNELYNFILDKKESFEKLSFEIEPFGGKSILIKALPYGFNKLENKDTLMTILEEVAWGHPYKNFEALLENIRSTIACKASIKAGDILTIEEMNSLVNELINLDYSSFCPHGRPVVIKFSKVYLDKMFHR